MLCWDMLSISGRLRLPWMAPSQDLGTFQIGYRSLPSPIRTFSTAMMTTWHLRKPCRCFLDSLVRFLWGLLKKCQQRLKDSCKKTTAERGWKTWWAKIWTSKRPDMLPSSYDHGVSGFKWWPLLDFGVFNSGVFILESWFGSWDFVVLISDFCRFNFCV